MNKLIRLMKMPRGRVARVLLGLVLIGVGLGIGGGTPGGIALVVVGLVPIAMGAWGHCLLEAIAPRPAAH